MVVAVGLRHFERPFWTVASGNGRTSDCAGKKGCFGVFFFLFFPSLRRSKLGQLDSMVIACQGERERERVVYGGIFKIVEDERAKNYFSFAVLDKVCSEKSLPASEQCF